jgi:hypothetical protein
VNTSSKFEVVSAEERLARFDSTMCAKLDTLKDAIAAVQLSQKKAVSRLILWTVPLYIGLAVSPFIVITCSRHWL